MHITSILVAVVVAVLLIARRARPRPVREENWAKPLILSVVGLFLLHDVPLTAGVVAFTAVSLVLALASGALRGAFVRLRRTPTGLVSSWGPAAFGAFALLVVLRLGVDAIATSMGVPSAALGQTVLLTLGASLLAESLVVAVRVRADAGHSAVGSPVH
ncbi:hypothetical protein SAMN06264364_12544 [Quadrisphaera granulorum]|uniref:DUF1453 family protein n=1 Tax=Quadrisphaera granulorum TaxID=317664 RepID=A0A316AI39_9ACTN|nr:hypothetical protein [Quadrisphaera granulorum]PWJ49577.1 hypothetical protein BXY45_12544 [Quadrisphaera granulorum]SZE98156.1 hypothetical protein SAMN06264364_12544 [Quadrisphaera granulorum]